MLISMGDLANWTHGELHADPGLEFTGFAFGFGMDRFGLSGWGVDDLREMFTNDVRFVRQF